MAQNVVGFGVVYGNNLNYHLCGTLPTEPTIFTAEIKAVLSQIDTSERTKVDNIFRVPSFNSKISKKTTRKACHFTFRTQYSTMSKYHW